MKTLQKLKVDKNLNSICQYDFFYKLMKLSTNSPLISLVEAEFELTQGLTPY